MKTEFNTLSGNGYFILRLIPGIEIIKSPEGISSITLYWLIWDLNLIFNGDEDFGNDGTIIEYDEVKFEPHHISVLTYFDQLTDIKEIVQ